MNSNYGKTGSSLRDFDFDLGIGSNRSKSLNDQKNKSSSQSSSYSSASSYSLSGTKPGTGTTPSWQPNKPSWTPQPAPARTTVGARSELAGPTSMVGDIFGRSWSSAAPTATSVGVPRKDPSLFGDLVSSALGHNKTSGNTPLKNAGPASAPSKSPYSMGSMADSLPKGNEAAKKVGNGSNWGSSDNFGGMNKSSNVAGSSVHGSGTSMKGDPLGSLFDLGSKPSVGASLKSATIPKPTVSDDWGFGGFQDASKSNATTTPAPMGSNQAPLKPSGSDAFDILFPSSLPEESGNQQSSGGDDWGFESEIGGRGSEMGCTTELEGLPPPPSGVSASSAKSKGLDNYKQGQYADAIKWLSWAVILLEKNGDTIGNTEVLTCRASCYKEVGEYKKAVADCTKVLDRDAENTAVLVQRAMLYESMEKYKLGAEDLRTVMKLDPGNRVARSTIHRLTKMID
ncbi:hypothetical protein V2J09_023203 [Rumex salicifolius]